MQNVSQFKMLALEEVVGNSVLNIVMGKCQLKNLTEPFVGWSF